MTGNLAITNAAGGQPTQGTLFLGNTGTKYIKYNGADFELFGGHTVATGNLQAQAGAIKFGYNATGGNGIFYDGSNLAVRFPAAGGAYIQNDSMSTLAQFGPAFNTFVAPSTFSEELYAFKGVVQKGSLSDAYNLDATQNTVTVAHTAIIVIVNNFSGVVITNSYSSGSCEMFICGGANTVRVAGSGAAHVTASTAAAQNGYVFYNNTGVTSTFGVITLRTRPGY
jgi:hypothetical protein